MAFKVLIVDDSKLARMAAIKILTGCHPDWTRVEAGTAADAVQAMERDSPDIALIDFNMPGQDGLELAAGLRKAKPGMPIAMISANHQQEVVARTHALGATFLAKPLSDAALREFFESALKDLKAGAS